jgi:hypothetical protein
VGVHGHDDTLAHSPEVIVIVPDAADTVDDLMTVDPSNRSIFTVLGGVEPVV